jgi:DNA-directed RNA polymerase beta subunit
MRVLPGEREDAGLQSVFKSVFPITDLRENCSLEFVDYSIGNWECKCGRMVGLDKLGRPCTFCGATLITDPRGDREIHCPKCGHLNENRPVTCETCDEPVGLKLKYDVDECQERGMTFAVPLKVTIRLVVWDKDPETGAKTIRDIKEQEVYYGDIPLMTENGTFIINGTERVIVSQLHRSPGVFFSQPEKGLFAAQVIPYRGSWIEFEYDSKNLLHVRIDRKRKFLASVFLRALGLKNDTEVLKTFYKWDRIQVREGKLFWKVSENLVGLKLSKTIHGPKDAARLGIEVVYQDLALCDNLTVVQNMYLGREANRWQILDEATMEQSSRKTLEDLSVTTVRSIRQPVGSLSGGQRQSVAVAKAVMSQAKLVIMDEPTAALGVVQTTMVLDLIKRLSDRGVAVLVISHNLNDVFEVADRIAVLYLGRLVASGPASEFDRQSVVEYMTTGRAGAPSGGLGTTQVAS